MTVIISHPACLLHNAAIQHPESPERLKVITKALASSGLEGNLTYEEAPLATEEQLYRVHDKKYIDYLLKLNPNEGFTSIDGDTIIEPAYFFCRSMRCRRCS